MQIFTKDNVIFIVLSEELIMSKTLQTEDTMIGQVLIARINNVGDHKKDTLKCLGSKTFLTNYN